jgi:tRNA A-37 threonylcarbamoyl transferase component Bud32
MSNQDTASVINSIPISKFQPNSIKVMGDKLQKHHIEIDVPDNNKIGPATNSKD